MSSPEPSRPLGSRKPVAAHAALAVAFGVVVSMTPSRVAEGRDILRNGGGSPSNGSTTPNAINAANAAAAQAAVIAQRANDTLRRTTQALQDMQSAQARARALAAAAGANNLGTNPNNTSQQLPDVLNGLIDDRLKGGAGGLIPDSGIASDGVANTVTTWTGAKTPTQKTDANGNKDVTVVQTQQQALLNWQTFNIGKDTTLTFDQSAGGADVGTWIAFNKINDPSGIPSQILGSIQATGQVYVINQNGIIFGPNSQVNTHALVASALPINDNLVANGLLNNTNKQFLFSSFVTDPVFTASSEAYTLANILAPGTSPKVQYTPPQSQPTNLVLNQDYTLSTDSSGRTVLKFTAAGLYAVSSAPTITISYTTRQDGIVQTQSGALLSCPTNSSHSGGRVALIAPNVVNSGVISTPDGQTILAAGQQVAFVEHNSDDASLRGLDVYVGLVADPAATNPPTAGIVTNAGLIDAPRADVTLAGKNVNQLGVINSTTSVSLNGRIDLLAEYNSKQLSPTNTVLLEPTATGMITLGQGSMTQILPELWSTDTVIGTQLALASQITMRGLIIDAQSNSLVLAPNANVNINAGNWLYTNSNYQFVHNDGQFYLDSNAIIDVAGSRDIQEPVSSNLLTEKLLGSELADSPLQRSGLLRGQTIQFDIRQSGVFNGQSWVGTPLGDLSGWVGLIQRSVGALTTNGGTVTINAGSSAVLQVGSKIDVSGGWIDFTGGLIQTTRVLSGGHLYDISSATPDMVYDAIYAGFTTTHSKWSVTNTYTSSLIAGGHYEPDYKQGGNGGSINITAPSMALDGEMFGNSVTGPRQRQNTPSVSQLSLIFEKETAPPLVVTYSPSTPNILFQSRVSLDPADPFGLDNSQPSSPKPLPLRADRQSLVVLSPDLLEVDGFGVLFVDNSDDNFGTGRSGNIIVPKNVSLNSQAGGSITLNSANIDIEGSIIVPGGILNLNSYNISKSYSVQLKNSSLSQSPQPVSGRGLLTLSNGAILSTAGRIVDNRQGSVTAEILPSVLNGGAITLAGYNVNLSLGSTIDASGGVSLSENGKASYGAGGSIIIKAGQDQNIASLTSGKLELDSTLLGYGGIQNFTISSQSTQGATLNISNAAKGGALTLQTPLIQIGGAKANSNTFLLEPDFFNTGGFSSFTINGIGSQSTVMDEYLPGLVITPGTDLEPVVKNRVLTIRDGKATLGSLILPSQASRSPLSLSFNAIGATDPFLKTLLFRGDLTMGAGAIINAGPQGVVSLGGDTVSVKGSISAPGGTITLTGGNSLLMLEIQDMAFPTVYLGPNSILSTAGEVELFSDPRGYHTGSVLSGGNITLSGNIVAASGAEIDVSGASGVLDLLPNSSGYASLLDIPKPQVIATRVDSNAGSITLKGGQELFTAATLKGTAGGPSALGGSLTVSSGRYQPVNSDPLTPLDVRMIVTQSTGNSQFNGDFSIGQPVLDSHGNPLLPMGYFSIDQFNTGGFDVLSLPSVVKFSGPIEIDAKRSISIANTAGSVAGGVIYADSDIRLNAPYISLGTTFRAPAAQSQISTPYVLGNQSYLMQPSFGSGNFSANAKLIDIGYLSLQNIGNANFTAINGDIRGNGTLDVAGAITMTAGQIYPPTASSFTIAAYDYSNQGVSHFGSATISAAGSRQLPLSAGGELNIYASIITQGGVLRAPIGTINLGWNGLGSGPLDHVTGASNDIVTGRTFPVAQQLTLANGSITSVSAIDSLSGKALTIPYGVSLDGASWIDPTGTDITANGAPVKTISISALNIADMPGSTIDISGGGDLYAYQWVKGLMGSADILAWNYKGAWSNGQYNEGDVVSYKGSYWYARSSNNAQPPSANQYWKQVTQSFAIIPGYDSNYAPYAPYNPQPVTATLGEDQGYTTSGLSFGDQVYLAASNGLPAGVYTLLPARYALLSGAFLVTPQSGIATGRVSLPDNTNLVSGYRFNSIDPAQTGQPVNTRFQVSPASVVRSQAQYNNLSANNFFKTWAANNDLSAPRSPLDSGQLILSANQTMSLEGLVLSRPTAGGRGGLIDISSPADILITGPGVTGTPGVLVLDSSSLSNFGAESLLIGGVRQSGANGTTINVTTNNILVDNAGAPLTGPDITLVSNIKLTLAPNAEVIQSGNLSGTPEHFSLGNSTNSAAGTAVQLYTPGSGITFPSGTPITLPSGTPGNSKISTTTGGSLNTTSGGTLVTNAKGTFTATEGGSIQTSNGATIVTAAGGSFASSSGGTFTNNTSGNFSSTGPGNFTASQGGSLTTNGNGSATIGDGGSIISSGGGTITLKNGQVITLAKNATTALPAGSSVTFSGNTSASFTGNSSINFTGNSSAIFSGNSSISLNGSCSIDLNGNSSASLRGNSQSNFSGQSTANFVAGTNTASFNGNSTVNYNGSGTITLGGLGTFTPSSTGALTYAGAGNSESVSVTLPVLANFTTTGVVALPATTAIQLSAPGSTVGVSAGNSILLSAGTPGNDKISANCSVIVTSGGVSTTYAAGTSLANLRAGSTLTFANDGTLSFTNGSIDSTGVIPAIPIIFSPTNRFVSTGVANITPAGSGDGTLLRVSSNAGIQISRTNINNFLVPWMSIGANATISGEGMVVDSTYATLLNTTNLSGKAVYLNSGQISLQLQNAGNSDIASVGLIMTSAAVQNIQSSVQNLSLLSYSSIDIYGTGAVGGMDASNQPTLNNLAFHSPEIRGFNNDGGTVVFNAKNILLDNSPVSASLNRSLPTSLPGGSILEFNADTIELGVNQLNIDQFASLLAKQAGSQVADQGGSQSAANQFNLNQTINQFESVIFNAFHGIFAQGSITSPQSTSLQGASVTDVLSVQGALTLSAPVITGATGAVQTIISGNALTIERPANSSSTSVNSGLSAKLTLLGASVTANTNILLPSGNLALHATSGDLNIGTLAATQLDVGGIAQQFYDLVKYTDAGQISLIADNGNIDFESSSSMTVSQSSASHAGMQWGGNAGSITISAPQGALTLKGNLFGAGGIVKNSSGTVLLQGQNGAFSLDVAICSPSQININGSTRRGSDIGQLEASLNAGSFDLSQTIRIRGGLVQSVAYNDVFVTSQSSVQTQNFDLSADLGSIWIAGTIDAHGNTGGNISIQANRDVTLLPGSLLTVAADHLNDAGQGGAVSLETRNGTITIAAVSTIDLSVNGGIGGTLHLRAPQDALAQNVAINPLNGTIKNASSIIAEGFFVQDANTTGAASIDDFEAGALSNAQTFMSNWQTIQDGLLANNTGLAGVFHVQPGEEIINSKGNLVLNKDWDLTTWRFGAQKAEVDDYGNPIFDYNYNQVFTGVEPGILTLRAKGSIIFNGSLSDGFGNGTGQTVFGDYGPELWREELLPHFDDGTSQLSWSYRITAGADFTATDYRRMQPLDTLVRQGTGYVLLGVNGDPINGGYISNPFGTGDNISVSTAIISRSMVNHYQVIRTGAGSIDISAGLDLKLLNQFATVYSAGARVGDPTMGGSFDLPQLYDSSNNSLYAPQYSFGGGNVTIAAQRSILHETTDPSLRVGSDSVKELPINWLSRRGFVDPTTGEFGTSYFGDIASTSWWVNFSNFFEGIGALGGGNVTMTAGASIINVDAVIPTNARMPKGVPSASALVELGGGDLNVLAGNNIDGGVYYVERGIGTIKAGNTIHTNSTRSPSLPNVTLTAPLAPQIWLPTTLFLGKGSFNVTANGDLTLGPVANPFLLPADAGNSVWYKTYFSTYTSTDAVAVSSLTGDVTLRECAALSADGTVSSQPLLQIWLQQVDFLSATPASVSCYQPWLRLDETSVNPFGTVTSLMPPILYASSFSGNINIVGDIVLTPSAMGTIDLAAADSVNGLQIEGLTNYGGASTYTWGAGSINVSDADPNRIPGFTTPFAYQSLVGSDPSALSTTNGNFLGFIGDLFAESGSTLKGQSALQTKQMLHAAGILHAKYPDPLHIYAQSGDISGFTLYSGRAARVIAGNNLTDISFYIQNNLESDLSLVAAGHDITLYDPNSPLRIAARALPTTSSLGNILNLDAINRAGDIQINGEGTLEVLAGRHLDLGLGRNSSDPTDIGAGITSNGNARNPYLPFSGADVIVGAGLGDAFAMDNSQIDFTAFISKFLNPGTSGKFGETYLPLLTTELKLMAPEANLGSSSAADLWAAFTKLSADQQDSLALQAFYLILRDAGRQHLKSGTPGFGYQSGYDAISTLFPGNQWSGNISLSSRTIKTENGGNISLFAPGGGLSLGNTIPDSALAPPGIVTEYGGDVSIFVNSNVDVGNMRIFTLRGGNEIIWATMGNIAAGSSAKTVKSAPPTRVLIDPQSADVKTDLAGLATGGGIGVLAAVKDVPTGDVDLIAPKGTIDAGDAGIRATGNLNVAAQQILNASNIQVGGASTGTPVAVAPPSLGGLSAVSNASAAATNSSSSATQSQNRAAEQAQQQNLPSLITVEVLGYGGGEGP